MSSMRIGWVRSAAMKYATGMMPEMTWAGWETVKVAPSSVLSFDPNGNLSLKSMHFCHASRLAMSVRWFMAVYVQVFV